MQIKNNYVMMNNTIVPLKGHIVRNNRYNNFIVLKTSCNQLIIYNIVNSNFYSTILENEIEHTNVTSIDNTYYVLRTKTNHILEINIKTGEKKHYK